MSPWTALVLGVPVVLALATISWLGLFRTNQLQRKAAERLRRDGESPMFTWGIIQSPFYLWQLRLVGLGAGIGAFYVAYGVISMFANN